LGRSVAKACRRVPPTRDPVTAPVTSPEWAWSTRREEDRGGPRSSERAWNFTSSPIFSGVCLLVIAAWAVSFAAGGCHDVAGDLMAAVRLMLLALLKNAERGSRARPAQEPTRCGRIASSSAGASRPPRTTSWRRPSAAPPGVNDPGAVSRAARRGVAPDTGGRRSPRGHSGATLPDTQNVMAGQPLEAGPDLFVLGARRLLARARVPEP
jgi:hypothetical protein